MGVFVAVVIFLWVVAKEQKFDFWLRKIDEATNGKVILTESSFVVYVLLIGLIISLIWVLLNDRDRSVTFYLTSVAVLAFVIFYENESIYVRLQQGILEIFHFQIELISYIGIMCGIFLLYLICYCTQIHSN